MSVSKTTIPDSKPLSRPLLNDAKARNLYELIKISVDKVKQKDYLASFLLRSQVLENILLPDLIVFLSVKLDMKHGKSLAEGLNFYQLNLIYLAISHDEDLFEQLENFRSRRNIVIHKITELKDPKIIDKETKTNLKLCTNILKEIIYRLEGLKPIPVLSLYSRGWNDLRDKVLKEIDNI